MKQLPRRLFLKALAAAPAVAQRVAEEAVGVAVATGSESGALMGGPPVAPMMRGSAPKMLELAALAKTGLLPDWAKRQALRNLQYDRRLDPDVACLQSVSLSAKLQISVQRRMARGWQEFERDALDQKLMSEFMGWGQP
jgi:hypothetical protein